MAGPFGLRRFCSAGPDLRRRPLMPASAAGLAAMLGLRVRPRVPGGLEPRVGFHLPFRDDAGEWWRACSAIAQPRSSRVLCGLCGAPAGGPPGPALSAGRKAVSGRVVDRSAGLAGRSPSPCVGPAISAADAGNPALGLVPWTALVGALGGSRLAFQNTDPALDAMGSTRRSACLAPDPPPEPGPVAVSVFVPCAGFRWRRRWSLRAIGSSSIGPGAAAGWRGAVRL
jgi:hypothetical protein